MAKLTPEDAFNCAKQTWAKTYGNQSPYNTDDTFATIEETVQEFYKDYVKRINDFLIYGHLPKDAK